MNEAKRNECSFERLVMRLMDEAGLCAYGEDTGSYDVPAPDALAQPKPSKQKPCKHRAVVDVDAAAMPALIVLMDAALCMKAQALQIWLQPKPSREVRDERERIRFMPTVWINEFGN